VMTEAESAQVARLFQDAWKLLARLEELQRRLPSHRCPPVQDCCHRSRTVAASDGDDSEVRDLKRSRGRELNPRPTDYETEAGEEPALRLSG
jgi:hypothetical protein